MNDLLNIIKNRTPLIDLRAPIEFIKGAFPSSINIPILNDVERTQVGLTYKYNGQNAAVELGYNLVEKDKEKRVQLWKKYIKENPTTHIYCMRGGQRSKIAKKWLSEAGVSVPVINGGYKAIRQAIVGIINSLNDDSKKWIILAGRTGTGKTEILKELHSAIDLEGLANHRGSAFGGFLEEQPTVINFENTLAFKYINLKSKILFLEDESRRIGKIVLPELWFKRMKSSDIIIIELPMEERIANIKNEYVTKPLENGISKIELNGLFQSSLYNIRKRLGLLLFDEISTMITNALIGLEEVSNEDWIKKLLDNYYDPMYDYQLQSKIDRCIFKGYKTEVVEFMKELEEKQMV